MIDPETLRFELRRFLVGRHPTAITADAARAGLKLWGHDAPLAEVESAAAFLKDLGQVEITRAPLGSTKYLAATAAGVLAHERGE